MFRIAAFIALIALSPLAAQAAEGPPGHSHAHGDAATSTDGMPGKASEAKRTIQVEARDTAFNVRSIQVRAGETIRFVVTNAGREMHEFAIASAKEHEEHRAMMKQNPGMVHEEPNVVTVAPGETKELIWKFGRDANVEFSCNISDHAEQGMKGAFRVAR